MAVIAFMMTISASAQFYIYYSDGTVAKVDSISMVAPEESEDPYNGHEYVDLGLSVKWATMNVGASSPEDYGDYFAWGETSAKSTYNWSTYKYCNGSYSTLTKYYTSIDDYGTVDTDNKTQLDLTDDAARVNWGGAWRMPTEAELKELCKQCYWTWITQNGINGYKVTGPNGNSIFLPAAGYRHDNSLKSAGSYGCYWSSSLCPKSNFPDHACSVYFHSNSVEWSDDSRFFGQSVRPVCPHGSEKPEPSTGIGAFSVSADKQVTFSKGNLQYTQSTKSWSFASTQYEMLGANNVTGGSEDFDSQDGYYKEGTALADKIDLFGWSTASTNFGVSTSENDNDYYGSFVDWGTNQIGNDAPNTWRTLTYDEWNYLLNTRSHASSLYGVAQVNGINGLVFLPDNWTCPAGITFKSGFHTNHSVEAYGQYQTFTANQWSKLEEAGAIFLPVTGIRYASTISGTSYSYYWSASENENNSEEGCCCFSFNAEEANALCGYNRLYGMSVRLVKDL